jgi:hypothetical protein
MSVPVLAEGAGSLIVEIRWSNRKSRSRNQPQEREGVRSDNPVLLVAAATAPSRPNSPQCRLLALRSDIATQANVGFQFLWQRPVCGTRRPSVIRRAPHSPTPPWTAYRWSADKMAGKGQIRGRGIKYRATRAAPCLFISRCRSPISKR